MLATADGVRKKIAQMISDTRESNLVYTSEIKKMFDILYNFLHRYDLAIQWNYTIEGISKMNKERPYL